MVLLNRVPVDGAMVALMAASVAGSHVQCAKFLFRIDPKSLTVLHTYPRITAGNEVHVMAMVRLLLAQQNFNKWLLTAEFAEKVVKYGTAEMLDLLLNSDALQFTRAQISRLIKLSIARARMDMFTQLVLTRHVAANPLA